MKSVIFSLIVTVMTFNIADVRRLYQKAPDHEASCMELLTLLENETSPVGKGYYGAALMVMASHYLNPMEKLRSFNRGKENLQEAIWSDDQNAELRYLRFTIQTNIPFFLNYSSDIESDKTLLLDQYSSITDTELKASIYSYLSSSSYLTEEEKTQLK